MNPSHALPSPSRPSGAGQFSQAAALAATERGYRAAIAAAPDDADALHRLGVLCHQTGRHADAISCLGRAAALRPADAVVHLNLGLACKAAGQADRAIALLGQAVRLAPSLAAAHFNLGNACLAAGRNADALAAFEATVRLDPDDLGALANLARAALASGNPERAALAANRAIALAPREAALYLLQGSALHAQERSEQAVDAYRTAVALAPGSLHAHLGAGTALSAAERYDEAIVALQEALRIDPECSPAWYNLGHAHLSLGNFDAAIAAFGRTLQLQPGLPVAHMNRALAWLAAGDFARGLPAYEWRLKTVREVAAPVSPAGNDVLAVPRWDGKPQASGHLRIDAEQGLGDTLQFLRFIPQARQCTLRLTLRVQPALLSLLKPLEDCWGIDIVGAHQPVPEVSCHVPLMSLPLLLGTTSATIPPMPALTVPAHYRKKWHAALASQADSASTAVPARRIGIAWSGRLRPHENRAIPLPALAPLFACDHVEWFVLQRDVRPEELRFLASLPRAAHIHLHSDRIDELTDTAAIVETLDAVVSIDTAIAHLAGSMGKPLWLLLAVAADWRWRLDRDSSRWYPSSKLLWQDCPGDWHGVIARLERELSAAL